MDVGLPYLLCAAVSTVEPLLHCALSLVAQRIVIGPVCMFATGGRRVCGCICVFVALLPR